MAKNSTFGDSAIEMVMNFLTPKHIVIGFGIIIACFIFGEIIKRIKKIIPKILYLIRSLF